MKEDKFYFGIFSSRDCYDEDIRKEILEDICECNDWNVEEHDIWDEMVDERIWDYLEDEKMNLDVETGGYILGFATLGLWWGRPISYKKIGTNVADIFDNFCGGDDVEWYADKYNVRLSASHHDGTNCIVYRWVESEEKADELCDRIYRGEIKSEEQLFRLTKSIRPFVSEVYGWKNYGRQVA